MRFGSRGPRKFFFSPAVRLGYVTEMLWPERAWKDAVQRLGNALSRSRVTISAGKQDNYSIDFMNMNTCKDTANWKVRRGCYVLSCYISRVKTLLHFGSLELLHFWLILRFASKVFYVTFCSVREMYCLALPKWNISGTFLKLFKTLSAHFSTSDKTLLLMYKHYSIILVLSRSIFSSSLICTSIRCNLWHSSFYSQSKIYI